MKARGLVGLVLVLVSLTCCAAEAGPARGKGYGLEIRDVQEALERGEAREALAYYER